MLGKTNASREPSVPATSTSTIKPTAARIPRPNVTLVMGRFRSFPSSIRVSAATPGRPRFASLALSVAAVRVLVPLATPHLAPQFSCNLEERFLEGISDRPDLLNRDTGLHQRGRQRGPLAIRRSHDQRTVPLLHVLHHGEIPQDVRGPKRIVHPHQRLLTPCGQLGHRPFQDHLAAAEDRHPVAYLLDFV